MTSRRATATAGVLIALAVLGAGCGDDDGGGSGDQRQEYIDAIEASADDDSGLDDAELTCVAESFVDGYGAEALDEAGVTPDELGESEGPGALGLEFSDEQQDDFYDRLTGCMDVRALVLDALSEGEDAPEQVRACLDVNLDDDVIRGFLITLFTEGETGLESDPELAGQLDAVFTLCVPSAGAGGA